MATRTGETEKHLSLKALAIAWARAQGISLAAPEVSFPHRRYRVDVAACAPIRKVPARRPIMTLSAVLKVAAVFECKQARGDLIKDNKRRELTSRRLKLWDARRVELEALLQVHLPQLANGETLFPEYDSYRLREFRHSGYRKLMKDIAGAKKALLGGTKFDRLIAYRIANLHYIVIEERLLEAHEVPVGWGLLARTGDQLQLLHQPVWQEIGLEHQLVFLQRIAARSAAAFAPAGAEMARDPTRP